MWIGTPSNVSKMYQHLHVHLCTQIFVKFMKNKSIFSIINVFEEAEVRCHKIMLIFYYGVKFLYLSHNNTFIKKNCNKMKHYKSDSRISCLLYWKNRIIGYPVSFNEKIWYSDILSFLLKKYDNRISCLLYLKNMIIRYPVSFTEKSNNRISCLLYWKIW